MNPHENPHHERRWLILAILGLAQLMVVLDATIVNIALPSAQEALGFSDSARQWVVTAYALAFGSLLLLGGRIGDLFGRKRVFIVGLIGFAGASALGGLAPSFAVLIGARALQGAFGAILAPAALSLLTTTFTDPDERGKAFGLFGGIAVAGAAIGLLMGGILTEYLSWRWCLYVNILFAVPTAIGALSLLHQQRHGSQPRLDIPGTLTASGGLLALVYACSEAANRGWGDPLILGLFAAAAALLVAFVVIERRSAHALLPMRVVLDRNRGGSYAAFAIAGAGMFGVFLFLTFYLQDTLGFSPVQSGLAFLPMTPAILLSSGLSSTKLLPRFGPRPLIVGGMLITMLGMVMFTRVGVDSSYWTHVLPGLIVSGLGMGLIFAPGMNTATAGVSSDDAGVASAMVNTTQQVGGSIGTALLNTLATSAVSSYLASRQPNPQVLSEAAVHGYTTAFWWSAGIFLAGAIVTALLLRPGVPEFDPNAQPALAH
ncbi:MAG TPA: MFS transporter [Solirubrobacterales bacterium]|nr:MFS transporter [Solirubrobacterales bacterium]